jgi:hypothetical protein
MMPAVFVTLAAMGALAFLYVLAPIVADAFGRHRRPRTLHCPETGGEARVQIDARHAARTALPGPPELRVADCSLWPERAGCHQACLRA